MNNELKPLAKSVLIPLGLTAAAATTAAAIHKKKFGSGVTTLKISNEEMNDIMKVDESLKESGFLIKDVNETIKNEAKKKQKGVFLEILLGTSCASLLGNLLKDKDTIRAGEGTITSGQDS